MLATRRTRTSYTNADRQGLSPPDIHIASCQWHIIYIFIHHNYGSTKKTKEQANLQQKANKKDGYRQQNVRQRQKLISIIDYDVCMTFY